MLCTWHLKTPSALSIQQTLSGRFFWSSTAQPEGKMELVKLTWRPGTAPRAATAVLGMGGGTEQGHCCPSPGHLPATCALVCFPVSHNHITAHQEPQNAEGKSQLKGKTLPMNSINEASLPLPPCWDQVSQKHALISSIKQIKEASSTQAYVCNRSQHQRGLFRVRRKSSCSLRL